MQLPELLLFLSGYSGFGVPGKLNKSFSKMPFKFSFLLLFLFLFISLTAVSQEENLKGQFNVGVQGGPQFTNISDYSSNYQMISKTGYTIGAFGEYYITNDFKLRLGAYFDNRKYEKYANYSAVSGYDSDSMVYTGYKSYYLLQIDYSLNYLTLPLNVIYQKGNEKVKVFVQFGIYYSLLLNATQVGSSDLYIDPEDAEHFIDPKLTAGHHLESYTGDVSYDYNSSDFGINFYIGGLFKISKNLSATFSPGLTYGFSNVFINPEIDSNWGSIIKLDAGIIYKIEKK